MAVRTTVTSCAAALVLFGCGDVSTSEVRSAETYEHDSDDYSAWFEGITNEEVEDFVVQHEADQLVYPTEVPEPEHEGGPESVARVRSGRPVIVAPLAVNAVGTGSAGDGSGGGGTCAGTTVSDSVTLPINFGLSFPAQYVGTYGPVREHNIWASGSVAVAVTLTLSGSLTTGANGWSATIGVNATGNVTATAHMFQELVGPLRRRWFDIGSGSASGTATFTDSVTFTQTCNPPSAVVTSPGGQAITLNVTLDELTFQGYIFPRLQGPLVTRVRGALAQWFRNFINRQIAGYIQPQVFQLNQAYQAKKAELLAKLNALIPQGCGCAAPGTGSGSGTPVGTGSAN